jgi:type IX secretion system PorP/SprF family membrane protein
LCRALKILFLFVKVGILLGGLSMPALCQDLRFSQLFGSPLYFNSATAGIHGANKWSTHYRNQYTGLGSYVSYASSFDAYIPKLHGGIGLQVMHQDQNNKIYQQEGIWVCYAYQSMISKKIRIHGSLEAGYESFNVDFSRVTVLQQIDPLTGQFNGSVLDYEHIANLQSKNKMDLGAGLLAEYKDGFLGLSLKHLDQSGWGWEKQLKTPLFLSVHSSYRFHPPKSIQQINWGISPYLDFSTQGKMNTVNLGVISDINSFNVGLGLNSSTNNTEGWYLLLGFSLSHWKINYSFEQSLVTKWNAPRIAHELSLSYSWANKRKGVGALPFEYEKGQISRLRCPNFFK